MVFDWVLCHGENQMYPPSAFVGEGDARVHTTANPHYQATGQPVSFLTRREPLAAFSTNGMVLSYSGDIHPIQGDRPGLLNIAPGSHEVEFKSSDVQLVFPEHWSFDFNAYTGAITAAEPLPRKQTGDNLISIKMQSGWEYKPQDGFVELTGPTEGSKGERKRVQLAFPSTWHVESISTDHLSLTPHTQATSGDLSGPERGIFGG
jgi:hypothetical protein